MLPDAQAAKTPANRIAHFFYSVIICGTLLNSERQRQPKTVRTTSPAHFRPPLAGVGFPFLAPFHRLALSPSAFSASIFPLVILSHTSHARFGFLLPHRDVCLALPFQKCSRTLHTLRRKSTAKWIPPSTSAILKEHDSWLFFSWFFFKGNS